MSPSSRGHFAQCIVVFLEPVNRLKRFFSLLLLLLLQMFTWPGLLHAAKEAERKVWNPPARYDVVYTGYLTLFQVPQKQVVALCKQLFARNSASIEVTSRQKGCAWRFPGSCVVITIDKVYRGIRPEDVVRHEMGHCNGWPADHPE